MIIFNWHALDVNISCGAAAITLTFMLGVRRSYGDAMVCGTML